MARSSSNLIELADKILLGGMAAGTVLMLQPSFGGGLKWGFFLTLGCTVLEIFTAHLLPDAPSA